MTPPPRIVVLTPYFHPIIGGVESNAERFARYLCGAGVNVRVLTKRISPSLGDVDERDGVPIVRIGPFGDRNASGKWVMSPAVFRWLVRHASDYDIVFVVDYRGVGVAAIAARALTGRPVVVQAQTPGVLFSGKADGPLRETGLPPEGPVARIIRSPVRAVYRRADAIACISHSLEREAIASGVPAGRVHFVPNAVDMSQFAPASLERRRCRRLVLGLEPDDIVCLFVGRLSREKGVLDLVDAWTLLQPAGASLLIAGPDMTGHPWNAGPAARDEVERRSLSASVRFLGPSTDVASLLQVADVVVQPSHFEALGLSAIEALASGVPVVASAVGGLLDFIVDGVNGRLVPPRNPSALASALRDVLVNPTLREQLAAAARASVAEYDEPAVFNRMVDLLTTISSTTRR